MFILTSRDVKTPRYLARPCKLRVCSEIGEFSMCDQSLGGTRRFGAISELKELHWSWAEEKWNNSC